MSVFTPVCAAAFLPVVESPWSKPSPELIKQCKEDIFHQCIFLLFTVDFLEAQCDGIDVITWSGKQHHGVPIVGLWVADHPEQAILGLTSQASCPFCIDPHNAWHKISSKLKLRKAAAMQAAFAKAKTEYDAGHIRKMIDTLEHAGHACNSKVNTPFCPTPNALWVLRF